MKIVRLRHERCAEFSDNSFVLAPDNWDNAKIRQESREAQVQYMKDFEEFSKTSKEDGPPNPGYQPDFKHHSNQDKTVAQVTAEWEKAKEVRKEFEEGLRNRWRSFEDYLYDRGFKSIFDGDMPEVLIDWGHNHGKSFKYGQDELTTKSMNALLTGEDDDFY